MTTAPGGTPATTRGRLAVAGAVAVLLLATGCSRHPGTAEHQPPGGPVPATAPVAGQPSSLDPAGSAATPGAAAAGASALDTAIDHADPATTDAGDDLSESTGSPEGDPTQ